MGVSPWVKARADGRHFSVTVIDSRPSLEGRGRVVQVDPVKPELKAPGNKRLKTRL